MLVKEPSHALEVVVAERQRQIGDGLGNPGIHRRLADEPIVVREEGMVAAKGHEVSPGVGSGQLHGRRIRRRPILGELDLVGSFDDPEHCLGAFDLDRDWAA